MFAAVLYLTPSNEENGCVRVSNDVIRQLAMTLPLGTPVLIR